MIYTDCMHTPTEAAPAKLNATRWFRLILAALILPAINAGLNMLIQTTPIPLFLDSIGTGVAAVIGLPYGLLTALVTNFVAEALAGFPWTHAPFALCGMATALIVWWMAKTNRMHTPMEFIYGTFLVALANSILGALIAVFVFDGGTGTNIDVAVAGFALALDDILSAAFLARLAVNLLDKAPVVLAAMIAARYLHPTARLYRPEPPRAQGPAES